MCCGLHADNKLVKDILELQIPYQWEQPNNGIVLNGSMYRGNMLLRNLSRYAFTVAAYSEAVET